MSEAELVQLEKDIKQAIVNLLKYKKKVPYDESKPFFPITITIDIGDFE